MTPIRNKVSEVKAWIEKANPGDPAEVRRYIDARWPNLLPTIRETIFVVTLGETF